MTGLQELTTVSMDPQSAAIYQSFFAFLTQHMQNSPPLKPLASSSATTASLATTIMAAPTNTVQVPQQAVGAAAGNANPAMQPQTYNLASAASASSACMPPPQVHVTPVTAVQPDSKEMVELKQRMIQADQAVANAKQMKIQLEAKQKEMENKQIINDNRAAQVSQAEAQVQHQIADAKAKLQQQEEQHQKWIAQRKLDLEKRAQQMEQAMAD